MDVCHLIYLMFMILSLSLKKVLGGRGFVSEACCKFREDNYIIQIQYSIINNTVLYKIHSMAVCIIQQLQQLLFIIGSYFLYNLVSIYYAIDCMG